MGKNTQREGRRLKYCVDTWFFLQLANQHPKAINVWKEVKEGKGRLVVSTVVIAETVKHLLRKNLNKYLDSLSEAFRTSDKITIIDVTKEIAEDGGKYSFGQNIPTIDGIILSTAIKTEHRNILSDDTHYKTAEKQKLVKRIFW